MGSSSDKLPQFFKVFQPQTSSEKLMLPPAFESKLSGEIPSRVVLKINKKIWLINVVRIDGRLHFEGGGWSKFVLDNSLSFGEFMVFKYNGQRTFEVLILGRDGCEKESGNVEETEDSEEEPVVKHVDDDDDDDDYGETEESEEEHVDDDYKEEEEDEEEDDDDDDDYTMPKHFSLKYKYNAVQGKTNSIWG